MGRFVWLIPPLLGLAAYSIVRPAYQRSHVEEAASYSDGARDERPRPGAAEAFADFTAEWEELKRAGQLEVLGLDTAGLRSRLLDLRRMIGALPEDAEWSLSQDLIRQSEEVATELGRRQGALAWKWILETAPGQRREVMAGWAEVDPSAALSAVIASERREPCDISTLAKLLQSQAALGNSALLTACGEVPWELFAYPSDPFREGSIVELPEGADITPWLEGGAAFSLAKDGVQIGNLFKAWAIHDPGRALSEWEAWPDKTPNASAIRVTGILSAGMSSKADLQKIRTALENLPPDESAKVAAKLAEYRDINPPFARKLSDLYPLLNPAANPIPAE